MRYGISLATLGEFGDPRLVRRLAQAAEQAGWEGLFLWDHLAFAWGAPSGDPWIGLAAAATVTERLLLGTAVTALPRRRPQILAQTLTSLDQLSNGRVVLGAGLGGVPEEFTAFGEPAAASVRAAMLDEGLDVLDRLLCGATVTHQGSYYTVENVTLAPLPLQKPRPPFWIGGESNAALRRAARWDGWVVGGDDEEGNMIKTPQTLARSVSYIQAQRASSEPFQVAISGVSNVDGTHRVAAYAQAGATWWLESIHGLRGSPEAMLKRIEAGPPCSNPV